VVTSLRRFRCSHCLGSDQLVQLPNLHNIQWVLGLAVNAKVLATAHDPAQSGIIAFHYVD